MKKILLFISVVLVLLLSQATAEADRSYIIDGFYVDAQLKSDGSMDVEETISYNFSGKFNGVYRTIVTAGSAGIEVYEVKASRNDNTVVLSQSSSGNDNTYEILNESEGIKLKIYSKSQDEIKKFIVKYRVLNVGIKYNDVAELYWKFIGKDTDVTIKNFIVNLRLLKGTEKNNIKAFAHGPLSGSIQIVDEHNIALSVGELEPNTFVEARVLFPVSLIENSHNIVNKNMLNSIMSEEKKWANEANAKRQRARILVSISFFYSFLQLILIGFIYFKYDKEYETTFKGSYYRELPGDYSPAVMSVLWNFGKLNPRDVTATLMDLVRKKYITITTEVTKKKGIFSRKEDRDYVFILNGNADISLLSRHETFFIDWIFGNIGENNRVSLDDIEDYTKSKTGAQNFKSDYDAWCEYVKLEAEKFNFFDKSSVRGMTLGIVASLLGFALAVYTMIAHENILGFIVTLITSVILLIYSITVKRRSKYGVLQFQMWKAFKKFLLHFSRLDKAELPSVILWEHYLVYAITLGIAKEVIKQLKMVFREEDFNNNGLTYMYYGYYSRGLNHFDSLNSVTSAVMKATESTYQQAVSKLSSSSGSGGGFSGGGGGGGGGGGAGAF